mgnify:CR=1 FL=1
MKRIGVIGVGYLGQHHARILSKFEGIDFVGVADINYHRAEEIANLYNCSAFSDYRELLPLVDAVTIVTPTVSHYEIAREALLKGKDVFIEKPITDKLEDAQRLVKLARDVGRILQVGHLERYNPAYQRAKELIPLSEVPSLIIGERLSPFTGRGTDVDITYDLMIHDLDIVLDILRGQEVKDIRASGATVLTGRLDFATCWIEFEKTKVILSSSRVSKEKRRTITVFRDGYCLIIDFMNQGLSLIKDGSQLVEEINIEKKEPLKEELRDFVDCISSRKCPLVPGEDALRPLSLVMEVTDRIKGG